MEFEASLSTRTSYVASSASAVAEAVRILTSDEIARFCEKISNEVTPNFVSVTFSIVALKELKKERMLVRASCKPCTVCFSSVSVSTFARFNATSDSTHADVSNPDASPLNEMLTCLFLFYTYYFCSLPRGYKAHIL